MNEYNNKYNVTSKLIEILNHKEKIKEISEIIPLHINFKILEHSQIEKLYKIIEVITKWAMVDVFTIAIIVSFLSIRKSSIPVIFV